MPGSLTTPGRPDARDDAPGHVAFHLMHGVGTQNKTLSRLNGWPMRPLSTLRRDPRGPLRMTRGRCGSLLLHREGLAPSTPCRSPGASQNESASLIAHQVSSAFRLPTTRCQCRSRARASLRNRHQGPSIMGFEDKVERS
jgi:hypothetical protein